MAIPTAASISAPIRTDGFWLKATLLVTSTLTVMAGATVSPALPEMGRVFADVPNAPLLVRLVLTLPALFIAVGAPVAGAIVDRVGRKGVLVTAIVLYGLAGASGLFLPTLGTILMGRAALGIAVAGIMTSVTTLIADYYEGDVRARFLGLQAAFVGGGGTIFLTLGGILVEINWRGPFAIYLLAFAILPLVLLMLFEPPREQVAANNGVGSPTSAAFPLGLAAFIYGMILLTQVVFYFVPVQLPFYLEALVGATGTQNGLATAGIALAYAIASATFGWFNARLGRVVLMILGFALTGVGFVLIGIAQGWPLVMAGLALSGAGLGLIIPNLNVWLLNRTPAPLRGRALGGFATALFLGQFLSPFVSQPLSRITATGGIYRVSGWALLGLVALLLALRGPLKKLGQ